MTQDRENKLDRIEELLLQTASRLDQVAQQQETNTASINQLTMEVDALVETVSSIVADAEADRQQAAADRQQAAIERQAWQAEIRQIWQYLLQQHGNGRGETS